MNSLYLQDWPALLPQTAHVITAQLTDERHGQLQDNRQFKRLSSFSGNGVLATVAAMIISSYQTMARYSVLPALSLDGILYVKIVQGSFTYNSFGDFIDGLLDQMNPFPGHNSVIVMDNCYIHKSEEVLERIIERWDSITLVTSLPNNKGDEIQVSSTLLSRFQPNWASFLGCQGTYLS